MQENKLLYLSQEDVTNIGLSMADIIDALEITFRAKGEGHTEMPPKPGIHPGGGDNFIHAMPAYIPDLQSAGVKWVSGFPENFKKELPYITGLLILNDAETGDNPAFQEVGIGRQQPSDGAPLVVHGRSAVQGTH